MSPYYSLPTKEMIKCVCACFLGEKKELIIKEHKCHHAGSEMKVLSP